MKKLILTILSTIILLMGLQFALSYSPFEKAQATTSYPTFPPLRITDWTAGEFEKLGGGNAILGFLRIMITWGLLICSAFAVIAFIYSGIMYITAGGSPEQAEKAKKNMVWAIIAVVVIAVCFLIPGWLSDILSKEASQ